MTDDGKVTPEEQAKIDVWNEASVDVTDAAMRFFLPKWFANIRELIRARFTPNSIEMLVEKLQYGEKVIAVLGSGPSMDEVLRHIPYERTLTLCGPTCVGAMLLNGHTPDVLVVADSNPIQYEIVRDLYAPDKAAKQRIILPVTADPSWYNKDSIFKRENMYFFLPYVSYLGNTDYAFNHVLKVLSPEVHRWIAQAGSVSNVMLTVADMICGDDPEKRVFVAVDCCGWLTDPPLYRAPAASLVNGAYKESDKQWHKDQINAIRNEAIRIPSIPFDLETTKISLGYAIQMLYLIYNYSQGKGRSDRYSFIAESTRLFDTLSPKRTYPVLHAWNIANGIETLREKDWAYKCMLDIIDFTNKLEESHGKEEGLES